MQACYLSLAGQLRFGSAEVIVAGRAPVSLSWIPKHDNRPGYVYAQSSQAIIIREGKGEPVCYYQPGVRVIWVSICRTTSSPSSHAVLKGFRNREHFL